MEGKNFPAFLSSVSPYAENSFQTFFLFFLKNLSLLHLHSVTLEISLTRVISYRQPISAIFVYHFYSVEGGQCFRVTLSTVKTVGR